MLGPAELRELGSSTSPPRAFGQAHQRYDVPREADQMPQQEMRPTPRIANLIQEIGRAHV